MALPPAFTAQVVQRLGQRWRSTGCPMCGTNQWAPQGYISIELSDALGQINVGAGAPVLPIVAMVCQNCGNTLFVNLAVLGLAGVVP